MKTVGNRIFELITQRKIKQNQLAKLIDVSPPTINGWINDKYVPKAEVLDLLSSALNTTNDYILYGKNPNNSDASDFRPVTRMLPLLTEVQAGNFTNTESITFLDIKEWLPAPPDAGKNSYYMIVRGTSNYPHFHDGDYVCIDPDINFSDVQTGDMIVVQSEDKATFKALVREYDNCYLQALNPNFQPNIIKLTEDSIYKGSYVGKFEKKKKFL